MTPIAGHEVINNSTALCSQMVESKLYGRFHLWVINCNACSCLAVSGSHDSTKSPWSPAAGW
jgi:hypothetical protein